MRTATATATKEPDRRPTQRNTLPLGIGPEPLLTVSYAEQGRYWASSRAVLGHGTKAKPKVASDPRSAGKSSAGLPTDRVLVSLAGKSVRTELDASGRATVQLSELNKLGKRTVTAWYAGSELLKSKTGKSSVKLKR